jgi:hypothetical protein
MRRLAALLVWPFHVLRGCSCDPRFVGVASDVACRLHGIEADLVARARLLTPDTERLAA